MPARRNGPVSSNVRRLSPVTARHAPTFTKETENEQAFHSCRSCRLFASRPAAVVAAFGGLGNNDKRNSDSALGERGRLYSRGGSRSNVMAGAAPVIQRQGGERRQALLVVKRFRQCFRKAQIPQEFFAHLQLVLAPAQRRLTIRSTGPIAAGRHLGYKSLAQIPAHRNRPVSSNVRPHKYNVCATRRTAQSQSN